MSKEQPTTPQHDEKRTYAGYTFNEARACDWTEDFTHENGNYWNLCITCERQFIGHKRRHVCKLCALPTGEWNERRLNDWREAVKRQFVNDDAVNAIFDLALVGLVARSEKASPTTPSAGGELAQMREALHLLASTLFGPFKEDHTHYLRRLAMCGGDDLKVYTVKPTNDGGILTVKDARTIWAALQIPVASSAIKPIATMPLIKKISEQRDECADALRRLTAVVEENFPMPAGVYPGSPLDAARKALANVPTYHQRLRNIAEGIGMTYEELMAAMKNRSDDTGQKP